MYVQLEANTLPSTCSSLQSFIISLPPPLISPLFCTWNDVVGEEWRQVPPWFPRGRGKGQIRAHVIQSRICRGKQGPRPRRAKGGVEPRGLEEGQQAGETSVGG